MKRTDRIPFDLILISFLSILCAVISVKGLEVWLLRVIASLLLLLILPGLAFRLALFAKRPFGFAEEVTIVVGTSVMLPVCSGIILNALGMKLGAGLWAVTLATITLVACVVAALRRQRLNLKSPLHFSMDFNWSHLVFLGLTATLIAGAAGFVALPLDKSTVDQGYTILWVQADQANPKLIHVGVVSNEFSPSGYRLSIEANDTVMYEWKEIYLAPGQKWEATYEVQEQLPNSTRIDVLLRKLDNPNSIYRQVWLSSESINDY